MKTRIKELRTSRHLTQSEFGEKIGATRDAIAAYERGVSVKEPIIKLICKEFNVNYSWLKDGIGEMESDFHSSIIDDLVDEYDLDDIDRKIIENYMKLDKNARKALSNYLRSLTSLWEDENNGKEK